MAISNLVVIVVIIVLVALSGIGVYYITTMNQSSNQSATQQSSQQQQQPLIIYVADAYDSEASAISSGFTNSTGIQTAPAKAGGSLALGQQIGQGNPDSVFISVSKSAVQASTLKSAFPGWAIAITTDQMALAYSNSTNAAATRVINAFNNASTANTTSAWFTFFSDLTSGTVKVGISNPSADPAGFRGWLVLEAAGYLYANNTNYFVNRMLSNSGNVTGASAAELVGPLQTGQIQFLFIYKSAVLSHKLNMLQLPSGVNLGNPSYNSLYSKFSYNTASGVQTGGVIALFITVPKNAASYDNAMKYIVYTINNYQNILKPYGLTPIAPAKLYNSTSIPSQLDLLITQGLLTPSGSL